MDLDARRYETFDDLYEVPAAASPPPSGLICVEIFGYRDPRAREYAIELGVALQLTNILRDVTATSRRGGSTSRWRTCGATASPKRICGARPPRPVPACGRRRSGRCCASRRSGRASIYAPAAAALPRTDARQLVAAEIMGAIYRGILDRIEARDYDVFSAVVRVPRPRRAVIAAATWAKVALGSGR